VIEMLSQEQFEKMERYTKLSQDIQDTVPWLVRAVSTDLDSMSRAYGRRYLTAANAAIRKIDEAYGLHFNLRMNEDFVGGEAQDEVNDFLEYRLILENYRFGSPGGQLVLGAAKAGRNS